MKDKNVAVYFMLESGKGYTKIGFSCRPWDRRAAVQQCLSPHDVRLVAEIWCNTESYARTLEQHLHKRFAEHRINGEWFNLSRDDIRRIIIAADKSIALETNAVFEVDIYDYDGVVSRDVNSWEYGIDLWSEVAMDQLQNEVPA